MSDFRKNIYFFYKHIFYQNDKKLAEKVTSLHEAAKSYGFTIVEQPENANIIASIGGDGTFLQAVRRTGFRQDVVYLGIDDDQFRGLYCDFQIDNLPEMIEAMKMEQVEVRKYPVIQVDIDHDASFYCLNEFTIRSAIIKTLVLDVFIDGLHFETFRGDGMVIATPTGSTAYNKSVRGAVVDPLLPCLQVNEMASLNSNRYRTLGSPFLLSKERTLTLKVAQEGNVFPTMGMDNEAMSIQHVKEVNIRLSDKVIKTVKLKNNSFWEKVKRTFL
ncbi:NAD kinase [Siminovitchia fortis]|uniref:NAD kinase n=1 Tax=Siminovitchia fortis TaxID=254758 RepID=A0A443IP18_9BACI|nr:NAD kinase [Siminovitchia fortis]RWR07755.1 NAD kinase [Siminovitchia fortis]WHY82311.1 NAD kinase [Siminovitchia fortis]